MHGQRLISVRRRTPGGQGGRGLEGGYHRYRLPSRRTSDRRPGTLYRTSEPVICNHLEAETRFRTPALDRSRRQAGDKRADEKGRRALSRRRYSYSFAGLLGIAVEHIQAEAGLQEALICQALPTRKMSHRVKNSLTSVLGLLRFGRAAGDTSGILLT